VAEVVRDPGRVVVVTPWYPNGTDPFAGAFVRQSVLALRAVAREVLVVHLENVAPDDARPATRYTVDDVEVAWIGVPTDPLTPRDQMARNQRAALLADTPPELVDARQVHVHVGMPTGWAVLDVLAPEATVVLTEHATYLGKIFRLPAAREMYAAAMARAGRVTAVSEFLARSIRSAVPGEAHKVVSLPNLMRLRDIELVDHGDGPLRHWLYVGRLVQAKGVERLVRAFARAVDTAPEADLRLTMVGQGPMREELVALADRLGVGDRVHLPGAVPPDEVLAWMARADVLVHLAHLETFGLTMVEAVASGLPVVATRSGGPQESLTTAEVLDRVRLVDVDGDVDEVLAAVADLEAVLLVSDPVRARASVVDRYDERVVVGRLDAMLRGLREPADRVHTAPFTVLGVSLSASAQRSLLRSVGAVVEQGGRAIVVTNRPTAFLVHGPAVEVVDLQPIEQRFVPFAAERLVVHRVPVMVLQNTRRVLLGLSRRVPAAPAVPLRFGAVVLQRVTRRWAKFARHRRPRFYARAYDQVAPWWLARVADRTLLADLRVEDLDLILTPDWRAQPFAWRLVRRASVRSRRQVNRRQVARMRLDADRTRPAP